jgi:hypothetical protein
MAKGNVDIACMIASYSMGESDWKSVPVKRGMNRRRSMISLWLY